MDALESALTLALIFGPTALPESTYANPAMIGHVQRVCIVTGWHERVDDWQPPWGQLSRSINWARQQTGRMDRATVNAMARCLPGAKTLAHVRGWLARNGACEENWRLAEIAVNEARTIAERRAALESLSWRIGEQRIFRGDLPLP